MEPTLQDVLAAIGKLNDKIETFIHQGVAPGQTRTIAPEPVGRVAANVSPPGTAIVYHEQGGDDSGVVVGQGWREFSFVPPFTGRYELSIGQRDPAFTDADVQIDDGVSGETVSGAQWRPRFGSFREFTPTLEGGYPYMLRINPIEPKDGAYQARFVPGTAVAEESAPTKSNKQK